MDPQPAQIAQDEAQRRQGGTGEAQERVLWVGLESDAVVKQGRDNCCDKEACIPARGARFASARRFSKSNQNADSLVEEPQPLLWRV